VETLSGSGTGGIESIESLRWLQREVGKGDAATHIVQIVNEPHQIVIVKVWHTLHILLPVKYVDKLVVKVGRRPVEAVEFLQHRGTE
jgi:hypothetical protein